MLNVMEFDSGRRRFLELTGTGTVLSLAGCSALQNQENGGTTADSGASDGDRQRVAVSTPADQQKLRQRQQKIQSELSSGNISRSEAQKQYQTAQQELRSSAISSFRERAKSMQNLKVVDSIPQFGVLLVAGTPAALIQTLSFEPVNALLPKSTFQQAKTQLQKQQQQQNSSSTSTASN